MQGIPLSKARQVFSRLAKRARALLALCGRRAPALAPKDIEALQEQQEEAADLEALRSALAEAKSRGEKPIPWSEARKALGRR